MILVHQHTSIHGYYRKIIQRKSFSKREICHEEIEPYLPDLGVKKNIEK